MKSTRSTAITAQQTSAGKSRTAATGRQHLFAGRDSGLTASLGQPVGEVLLTIKQPLEKRLCWRAERPL